MRKGTTKIKPQKGFSQLGKKCMVKITFLMAEKQF